MGHLPQPSYRVNPAPAVWPDPASVAVIDYNDEPSRADQSDAVLVVEVYARGGWTWDIALRADAGAFEVLELRIRPTMATPAPEIPLVMERLREFSLPTAMKIVRERVIEERPDRLAAWQNWSTLHAVERAALSEREAVAADRAATWRDSPQKGPGGRPPTSDEELETLALEYLAAHDDAGEHAPVQKLAERLGYTRSGLHSRLNRAVERGFLTRSTGKGVPHAIGPRLINRPTSLGEREDND